MKIVIAPDKFKGSLTSFEACEIIAQGFKQADPSVRLCLFPMADGGDGFANVMKHYLGTNTINCETVDPLERKISASYEWSSTKEIAIIEMAVASGLILLKDAERNPLKTSTYGTGLLINDAIGKGTSQIILGLGGSATNDGGIGILAALGFQFIDASDTILKACGENLLEIKTIISPQVIPKVKLEIACDVQNTLFGPNGAAYVYARQKGANDETIRQLDDGLKHFARILKQQTNHDVAHVPGSGAAGGIAAGLMAFFDIQIKSGVHLVIDTSGVNQEIADADLLVTGEGKIDEQTLSGKVVSELTSLALSHNVPVVAFCGVAELNNSQFNKLGLQFIGPLVSGSVTKEQAMKDARNILHKKATEFLKKNFVN